jgi:hypothetical protein
MNNKSLIKYRHGNERGLMHYVIFEGDVVVLSAYDSKKVSYIEENGNLDITFNITSNDFKNTKVQVIKDPEYLERVYIYMIETNNAYFTEGTEGLCVIKFEKQ